MVTDYSSYLRLAETQYRYFQNLLSKRNKYSDEAMQTPISNILNAGEDRTPLELAYHALDPLYQLCTILGNKGLEWGNIQIEQLAIGDPTKEFLQIYRYVLDLARNQLQSVELSGFTGNMKLFNDPENEEKFQQRLEILCMHILTHMGQVVKFQGMICNYLGQQDNIKSE